jgi:hypothetical protein
MAHRIINDEQERADFLTFVAGVKIPATFEWHIGRDRSLDQNRLQFLWAREASEQRGDMTTEEVRCEWKLIHGVPILRAESPMFREIYDIAIKPLPYDKKLLAMRVIAVTSEMTVPQMVRFLDAVQRECLEQGLRITDPDPSLAAYQQRYRQKEAA